MYHRRTTVASWKPTMLGPNCCTASTAKCSAGRWNTATPPWCQLGASVATTIYQADSRVERPSVTFVSWKIPRSMLAWDIPLNADSNPPFRTLRILLVPNLIGTVPLVYLPVLQHILDQQTPFSPRPPLPSPFDPASPSAVPVPVPPPLAFPCCSCIHSLPFPNPCRSPRHEVLRSSLITGQVALCSGYRGC